MTVRHLSTTQGIQQQTKTHFRRALFEAPTRIKLTKANNLVISVSLKLLPKLYTIYSRPAKAENACCALSN